MASQFYKKTHKYKACILSLVPHGTVATTLFLGRSCFITPFSRWTYASHMQLTTEVLGRMLFIYFKILVNNIVISFKGTLKMIKWDCLEIWYLLGFLRVIQSFKSLFVYLKNQIFHMFVVISENFIHIWEKFGSSLFSMGRTNFACNYTW